MAKIHYFVVSLLRVTTWGQFYQRSTRSFYARRSRKCKISVMSSVSFYAFAKAAQKKLLKLTPAYIIDDLNIRQLLL